LVVLKKFFSRRPRHGRQGDRGFAQRKKNFSAAEGIQEVGQFQERGRL
jgi:hypothetical protein